MSWLVYLHEWLVAVPTQVPCFDFETKPVRVPLSVDVCPDSVSLLVSGLFDISDHPMDIDDDESNDDQSDSMDIDIELTNEMNIDHDHIKIDDGEFDCMDIDVELTNEMNTDYEQMEIDDDQSDYMEIDIEGTNATLNFDDHPMEIDDGEFDGMDIDVDITNEMDIDYVTMDIEDNEPDRMDIDVELTSAMNSDNEIESDSMIIDDECISEYLRPCVRNNSSPYVGVDRRRPTPQSIFTTFSVKQIFCV